MKINSNSIQFKFFSAQFKNVLGVHQKFQGMHPWFYPEDAAAPPAPRLPWQGPGYPSHDSDKSSVYARIVSFIG